MEYNREEIKIFAAEKAKERARELTIQMKQDREEIMKKIIEGNEVKETEEQKQKREKQEEQMNKNDRIRRENKWEKRKNKSEAEKQRDIQISKIKQKGVDFLEEIKNLLQEMTTWEKDAEIIYDITKKHFPKEKIQKKEDKENLTEEEIYKGIIKEEEKNFRHMIGKGKKDMEKKDYIQIWKKTIEVIKKNRINKRIERGEEKWTYKNEKGEIKDGKEKEIKIIMKREDTRKIFVKTVEDKKKRTTPKER